MNVSKLTAALLALLVVSTGVGAVAATPGNGNAPDDAGTSAANVPSEEADANATDARDEGMSREEVEDRAADESDAANDSESMADQANASEGQAPQREEAAGPAAAADDDRRGPPADLPEQVPDHVGEIHQRIVTFLDGELDSLGAAVSDVTPADSEDTETDGDAEAAANADGEADAQATSTDEPETEEPTTEEPETDEPETEEDGDSTETATATPTTEA